MASDTSLIAPRTGEQPPVKRRPSWVGKCLGQSGAGPYRHDRASSGPADRPAARNGKERPSAVWSASLPTSPPASEGKRMARRPAAFSRPATKALPPTPSARSFRSTQLFGHFLPSGRRGPGQVIHLLLASKRHPEAFFEAMSSPPIHRIIGARSLETTGMGDLPGLGFRDYLHCRRRRQDIQLPSPSSPTFQNAVPRPRCTIWPTTTISPTFPAIGTAHRAPGSSIPPPAAMVALKQFLPTWTSSKVNDDYGHNVGDALLIEVAHRLQSDHRDSRHGLPARAATSSSFWFRKPRMVRPLSCRSCVNVISSP